MNMKPIISIAVATGLLIVSAQAFSIPPEEKLARKSGCFKCHAIEKKKDGTPYKEIAEKYRDKPDGAETLYKHLTTSPTVKIKDKEQKHKTLKTEDETEIRAVVQWILAQ